MLPRKLTLDVLATLFRAACDVINDGVSRRSKDMPEVALLAQHVAGPLPRLAVVPQGGERLSGHLPACIEAARNPLDRHLAEAIEAATPALKWASPYDSVDGGPQFEAFKDSYACTLLAGPEGFRSYEPAYLLDATFIAITLQFPGVFYPSHSHFAREIYHVIAGQSDWQIGEQWSERESGDWIFHDHNARHAMKTAGEPLLTLVTWIDGIDDSVITVHN